MTKKANFVEVNKAALKFVREYIDNKPLGLPESLSEEQFPVVMDAIVRAMLQAWGDGYYYDVK